MRVAVTGATGVIGSVRRARPRRRRPRRRRPGPHPGEGRGYLERARRARRAAPACSTTTGSSRCSRAPTRSATSPPTSRSASPRPAAAAPGGPTTGCAPRAYAAWSRPRARPGCAGSCRRASRSSTPTRATSGSREDSPLEITRATEPASVGESPRAGVRLRLPRRRRAAARHDRRRRPDDPVPAALRAARPPDRPRLAGRLGPRRAHRRPRAGAVLAALQRAQRGLQRRRRAGPPRRDGRRLRRGRRPREHRLHGPAPAPGRRGPPRAARPVAAGQLGPLRRARPAGRPRRATFDSSWFDALPTDVRARRCDEPTARPRAAARRPTELPEAERRRRRARVFGDVLPDSTRDERGDGWSERGAAPRAATSGSAARSRRTTAEPSGPSSRARPGDVGGEVEHELDGAQDAEHRARRPSVPAGARPLPP